MHIALYRKYRPKSFDDVVGQKYVVSALKNQIISGKIGHAFIFTGTRGTGKTTCAKIFAKAVNCLDIKNGNPCGECEICKGIDDGSIYDVVEMDAASNRGINDIRDIIDEVNYAPMSAKYRVYIIDEVHMLTAEASNALLKTIEEPPSHVIFILATTEINKVLPTILSRCQRYDFTKLSIEQISDKLMDIAESEGVGLTKQAAGMIASLADGAMRDAISIFETCLAASQNVDEGVVSNVVGIAKQNDITELVEELINNDTATALSTIMRLNQESVDAKHLCEELIDYFSNLLLASVRGSTPRLLNMTQERFDAVKRQAGRCSRGFISLSISAFTEALGNIAKGQQPRISMELAVYKITQFLSSADNIDGTLNNVAVKSDNKPGNSQISRVSHEQADFNTNVNERVYSDKPDKTAAPSNADSNDTKLKNEIKADRPIEFENWDEVIKQLKGKNDQLYSLMADSSAYIFKGIVYIKGSEVLYEFIRGKRDINTQIKSAITTVTGRQYNIGGYKNLETMFGKTDDIAFESILKLRDKGVNVIIKD